MKFVIVGGGISGWLSALIFSYRHPNHEYVIIESSKVNTIVSVRARLGFFLMLLMNCLI